MQGDRLQVEPALEVDSRDNVPNKVLAELQFAICGFTADISRWIGSGVLGTIDQARQPAVSSLAHSVYFHYCPLGIPIAPPQLTNWLTHCNVGTKPCTAVISGTPTAVLPPLAASFPALALSFEVGASLFEVLLGPAVGIDNPDMMERCDGGAWLWRDYARKGDRSD